MGAQDEQPAPVGDGAECWPEVIRRWRTERPPAGATNGVLGLMIADAEARDAIGRERYGTPLRVKNGRDKIGRAHV